MRTGDEPMDSWISELLLSGLVKDFDAEIQRVFKDESKTKIKEFQAALNTENEIILGTLQVYL